MTSACGRREKRPLLCQFDTENDHFAKTGSGQTQEKKVEGKGVFRRAEKAFGQFLFEAEYAKQVRNTMRFLLFAVKTDPK